MGKKQKTKKNVKSNKILTKVLLICILAYVSYVYINQQINLNEYSSQLSYYEEKSLEEQTRNSKLVLEKESINSDEYIEQVAREKLGLLKPNETMYVDSSKY